MKYLLIVFLILCLISCSNTHKTVHLDKEWFNKSVKKSDSLATLNIKGYLDTITGEKLYMAISQRYGKKCYPINFVKNIDKSKITFCNIPIFYIGKGRAEEIAFALDTTQTSLFMLFEERPFAMFRIYSFKNLKFVDLVQGVDSTRWERYNSRHQQGYKVFECKKLIDIGNNQKGNTYIPYVFYTKDNSDVLVYDWVHKKDLTLTDVEKKWLNE